MKETVGSYMKSPIAYNLSQKKFCTEEIYTLGKDLVKL